MSQAAQQLIGSVVSLWRYPVKSMMGKELNAAAVDECGLLGDRAYAVLDRSDGRWPAPRTHVVAPQLLIADEHGRHGNAQRVRSTARPVFGITAAVVLLGGSWLKVINTPPPTGRTNVRSIGSRLRVARSPRTSG
jgi:hypothetical protein